MNWATTNWATMNWATTNWATTNWATINWATINWAAGLQPTQLAHKAGTASWHSCMVSACSWGLVKHWPSPSIVSHRFSDPKIPKYNKRYTPSPYNLSNNPNKIKSLESLGFFQNPNFLKTLTVNTDET
jgi:hypothetical protein